MAAPEGHAWIKWAPDTEGADAEPAVDAYILERTTPGEKEPIVRRIVDTATFVAGLPEGISEVRVRALSEGREGPWSETLRIEVAYPSPHLVRVLGVLGTLLFIATFILIVVGHRRTRALGYAAAMADEPAERNDG